MYLVHICFVNWALAVTRFESVWMSIRVTGNAVRGCVSPSVSKETDEITVRVLQDIVGCVVVQQEPDGRFIRAGDSGGVPSILSSAAGYTGWRDKFTDKARVWFSGTAATRLRVNLARLRQS